jgi:Rrf2 family protein
MLSMKGKYALRALCVLAEPGRGLTPARVLAADAAVPEKFLEAILVELRNAGLVRSKRGLFGGHELAREATAIMVGDVIRCIDGPIAPLRCASVTAFQPCEDCADPEACAIRDLMADVRVAMSEVLDRRSLHQLAERARSGREPLLI